MLPHLEVLQIFIILVEKCVELKTIFSIYNHGFISCLIIVYLEIVLLPFKKPAAVGHGHTLPLACEAFLITETSLECYAGHLYIRILNFNSDLIKM